MSPSLNLKTRRCRLRGRDKSTPEAKLGIGQLRVLEWTVVQGLPAWLPFCGGIDGRGCGRPNGAKREMEKRGRIFVVKLVSPCSFVVPLGSISWIPFFLRSWPKWRKRCVQDLYISTHQAGFVCPYSNIFFPGKDKGLLRDFPVGVRKVKQSKKLFQPHPDAKGQKTNPNKSKGWKSKSANESLKLNTF